MYWSIFFKYIIEINLSSNPTLHEIDSGAYYGHILQVVAMRCANKAHRSRSNVEAYAPCRAVNYRELYLQLPVRRW